MARKAGGRRRPREEPLRGLARLPIQRLGMWRNGFSGARKTSANLRCSVWLPDEARSWKTKTLGGNSPPVFLCRIVAFEARAASQMVFRKKNFHTNWLA